MVTHIMAYALRAQFRESSDLSVKFPKARVNCVVIFRLKSMALITQSSDTGDLTTKTHRQFIFDKNVHNQSINGLLHIAAECWILHETLKH